jgi:hypothetical protein
MFVLTGCTNPVMRNIQFQYVTGQAENSVRINGATNSRIQNVRLGNVRVKLDRLTKHKGGVFDNRPTRLLETIETRDTYGFSIRHADDVTLKDCSITWGGNLPDYFNSTLKSEKGTGLRLTGFKGNAAHPNHDTAIFIR